MIFSMGANIVNWRKAVVDGLTLLTLWDIESERPKVVSWQGVKEEVMEELFSCFRRKFHIP